MAPHSAADSHQGKATKGLRKGKASKTISEPSPKASGCPPPQRSPADLLPAPIIRVIHIYAPKVIQTDVANFKAMVQSLTGKSKRRAKRSKATKIGTPAVEHTDPTPVAAPQAALMVDSPNLAPGASNSGASFGTLAGILGATFENARQLWEQEEADLQGLLGDGCGACHADLDLVRCNSSGDSATYSLDTYSGSNASSGCNLGDHTLSPTKQMHPSSFSFGTAFPIPHREGPYSLSEIPAPFLGAESMMHTCFQNYVVPQGAQPGALAELDGMLQMPEPADGMMMDHSSCCNNMSMGSMLGFDVEIGRLCPPLMADLPPFPAVGRSSSGGLFDMVQPQQHCRLSVQQSFQGTFFESSS